MPYSSEECFLTHISVQCSHSFQSSRVGRCVGVYVLEGRGRGKREQGTLIRQDIAYPNDVVGNGGFSDN